MESAELLDRLSRRQSVRGELCERLDLSRREFAPQRDLAGVVLVDPNLREVSLPQVDLSGAVLQGAVDLLKAKLHGANLNGVRIEGQLSGVELEGADVTEAQISGNLDMAVLRRAHGRNLTLTGATLYLAVLDEARLPGAQFRGLKMDRAHANGANLAGADFGGASLVRFSATPSAGAPADLSGVNFTGADLTGAVLDGATVNETTDFSEAHLQGASLRDVALARAVVTRAEIDLATYHHSGWTPDALALLIGKGLRRPADLERFPADARRLVKASGPVLVMTFEGAVTGWSGHIVRTLAFACLDVDLPSLSAEPLLLRDGASLWVTGVDKEQLATIAEAFAGMQWRTWAADRKKPERRTMAAMFEAAEELRARCTGMALRDDPRTARSGPAREWQRSDLRDAREAAGPGRLPWSREVWIGVGGLVFAALTFVCQFVVPAISPPTPAGSSAPAEKNASTTVDRAAAAQPALEPAPQRPSPGKTEAVGDGTAGPSP